MFKDNWFQSLGAMIGKALSPIQKDSHHDFRFSQYQSINMPCEGSLKVALMALASLTDDTQIRSEVMSAIYLAPHISNTHKESKVSYKKNGKLEKPGPSRGPIDSELDNSGGVKKGFKLQSPPPERRRGKGEKNKRAVEDSEAGSPPSGTQGKAVGSSQDPSHLVGRFPGFFKTTSFKHFLVVRSTDRTRLCKVPMFCCTRELSSYNLHLRLLPLWMEVFWLKW